MGCDTERGGNFYAFFEYLLKNSDAKLIPIGQGEQGIYHSPIYPETIHLFPHLFPGEGQYIAKIKKPGELEPARKSYESDYSRISTGPSGKKQIEKFIVSSPLLPKDLSNACIRYGYHKITECGDYFEPAHQWSHVIESNVPSIELTKEEVVKYMRGETILKEADELSDGFNFVSYKNMIIGNVKVIDGVLKNYYPKGLRISVDINNGF
jgi:NOL1/NOP2/fmu family ribosome biogenesis protein